MSLWTCSRREILGRPGRTILTLLSIVIGVGTAVAVSLATGTARKANETMFGDVAGHIPLEVVSLDGKRFNPAVADTIAELPGVASAEPIVRQGTILYFSPK